MKINLSKKVLRNWGVYKITNLINGDFYIGSTIEYFGKRISSHLSDYYSAKEFKKRKMCPILYNAFNKYGIENFEFSVLKCFSNKKDSKNNKRIATFLEEKLIKELNPKYNICKKPTNGGCPNLGRKLTDEWKRKIGEKSKLYKHSKNSEIYNKKSQQNKNLSSKYKVWKNDVEFIGSLIDCANFIGITYMQIDRWVNKLSNSKDGWNVQKLSSQKKRIRLYNNNFDQTFNSFGECDRFLKMWRGFTSTQVVNKKNIILEYKYELL